MNRPLIAAFDGSPGSETAAQWAAEEAVRRRSALRLVHAGPWLTATAPSQGLRDDARTAFAMLAQIQQAIQRRHPGLTVETGLVEGPVLDALVSVAREGEELVLGSRGLGGFAGLLVGSMSLATAACCRVPVVVVPSKQPDVAAQGGEQRVPEIVVGIDTRSPAPAVIEFAFAEAALHQARVRAVHGWDLPPSWSSLGWAAPIAPSTELERTEADLLSGALEGWRDKFPDTEVLEDLRIGGPAGILVEASARADLVVVGRRLRQHPMGQGLGPVAHAVIHHSKAPIAVVPHP